MIQQRGYPLLLEWKHRRNRWQLKPESKLLGGRSSGVPLADRSSMQLSPGHQGGPLDPTHGPSEYNQPSISEGSTSADSTNQRSKISGAERGGGGIFRGKKSRKFQEAKLELATYWQESA